MCDNQLRDFSGLPIGHQIRQLRQRQGLTLAELARRADTSASALHRYESGWDRFEIATLRKIARALGAGLEIRLLPAPSPLPDGERRKRPSEADLIRLLRPLFWDKELEKSDLEEYPEWLVARVLMFGDRSQVAAVRRFFGDDLIREAVARRGVDLRTRRYWQTVLESGEGAAAASRGLRKPR